MRENSCRYSLSASPPKSGSRFSAKAASIPAQSSGSRWRCAAGRITPSSRPKWSQRNRVYCATSSASARVAWTRASPYNVLRHTEILQIATTVDESPPLLSPWPMATSTMAVSRRITTAPSAPRMNRLLSRAAQPCFGSDPDVGSAVATPKGRRGGEKASSSGGGGGGSGASWTPGGAFETSMGIEEGYQRGAGWASCSPNSSAVRNAKWSVMPAM